MVLWSSSAFAAELHDLTMDYEIPATQEQTADKYILPLCDDEEMIAAVVAKIKAHQELQPAKSIIENRSRALIIKNLQEFNELSVENFNNASNYNVADAIIMTKINFGIKENQMRLCQSNAKSNIYLLIYPENNVYHVNIINFVAASRNNNFSITIPMSKE